MPDVMIDIETLGNTKDAVIIQIAAVKFHINGAPIPEEPIVESPTVFFQNVDAQSCLDIGMKTGGGTVMWWMGQSAEARRALFTPAPLDIKQVLRSLKKFIDWREDKVWACGPSFDCSIIETAFKLTGDDFGAWSFGNERCVRTLLALAEVDKTKPPSNAHNALADAWHQAREVQGAFQKLKGTISYEIRNK